MRYVIAFVTLLFIGSSTGHAQDRAADVEDTAWGLRFTPPEGWTQVEAPEGYVFAAPAQQGFLAVLPHEARTVDALRAEAAEGIVDEYGTQLGAKGPVEAFGDQGVAADFEGWIEGSPAWARVIGLISSHGPGATVLVAAAPEQFSGEHAALAERVARSVVFVAPSNDTNPEPSTSTQAAGSEEQEWHHFLAGCRLYISNSYNSGDGSGYIDETTIDLCPSYFTFSDKSMTVFNEMDPVSGDDPYLHSNRKGAGQWSVVREGGNSVLQLQFHNGSVKAFRLGWEDGKTYLDGKRWLRACDQSVSVGPQCE